MEPPVIETVQGAERPAARPDVFVYLIDTLRADALGAYGAARPASPRIDAFSRDAMVFDHAYSSAAWTLPATFSVLSGLYPSHHGVALPGQRLPPQRGPWLPELLSQSGYETLGICQWMLGGDPFGLERGFESFYLDVRESGKNRSSAIRWFLWRHLLDRRHPDRPLFVWMHAVDPHALYQPRGEDGLFARQHPGTLPAQLYDPQLFLAQGLGRRPADVEHLRALYDGEVHAADRRFGVFVDLLKFFGLYDESVIVLLSDHGEEFNEHGGFNHGRTLYDELLRVPLIVKLPQARRAGARVAAPVSLVDVAPTIARLAGVAAVPRQPFDGVSLLGAGGGRQRPILAETRADGVDLEAVRLGAWKCIANHAGIDQFGRPAPAVQAFDLAADPRERRPLPPSAARLARCRALLHDALSSAGTAATAARPQLPPDERARLHALGYVR
jgi:arylsulfatase A-like enzyme